MLDEPFSALDTHLRLKLQMDLKTLLSGYGKGILMVTHNRDEAFRMCERIGIMSRGRMLTVKKTKELFADPGSREAAVSGDINAATSPAKSIFMVDTTLSLAMKPVTSDTQMRQSPSPAGFIIGAASRAIEARMLFSGLSTSARLRSKL